MQRVILIIMLTILVGMVGYSWSSKESETSLPLVEHGGVSDFTEDRPLTASHITDNRTNASYPTDEPEYFDHVVFSEQLLDLKGKTLFSELDQFWGCANKLADARHNCLCCKMSYRANGLNYSATTQLSLQSGNRSRAPCLLNR